MTVARDAGERGVIGVGRVKTPTLAIVCKRELEILSLTTIHDEPDPEKAEA